MFRRGFFFFFVMCAAVGVPYVATEWGKVSQWFGNQASAAGATPGKPPYPAAGTVGVGGAGYPPPAEMLNNTAPTVSMPGLPATEAEINAPPVVELADALRFDVTASWILGRWPRVTAGLPDAGLQGYRVALVSGTQEDDLAGSLTYYFNRNHVCQRITFQGTTGDARELIAMLTTRYGFERQTSDDPSVYLYQIRWNGRATSELQVRPSRIIRASEPTARFEVLLAMNDRSAH
jgi:hypothetical protein